LLSLDLENNAEVAGELGPLQYLSNLTGIGMDKIINYLLLVIIFVFDPLAISLVVAANFAFANAFPKREEETPIPDVFEDEEFEPWEGTEVELEADPNDLDLSPEKDIEVTDPEIVKGDSEFLAQIADIEARMIKDDVIDSQQSQKITMNLESELI
jgi:hypothetical protein